MKFVSEIYLSGGGIDRLKKNVDIFVIASIGLFGDATEGGVLYAPSCVAETSHGAII